MTDLKEALSTLHEQLALTLLAKVRSGEATAAELNVARQFLKDNNIDNVPKDGSPMKSLVDELPFSNPYN